MLILWVVSLLVSPLVAGGKGRSPILWWLITLFLGPLATLIVVLLPKAGKKCPFCALVIPREARVCPFCRKDYQEAA